MGKTVRNKAMCQKEKNSTTIGKNRCSKHFDINSVEARDTGERLDSSHKNFLHGDDPIGLHSATQTLSKDPMQSMTVSGHPIDKAVELLTAERFIEEVSRHESDVRRRQVMIQPPPHDRTTVAELYPLLEAVIIDTAIKMFCENNRSMKIILQSLHGLVLADPEVKQFELLLMFEDVDFDLAEMHQILPTLKPLARPYPGMTLPELNEIVQQAEYFYLQPGIILDAWVIFKALTISYQARFPEAYQEICEAFEDEPPKIIQVLGNAAKLREQFPCVSEQVILEQLLIALKNGHDYNDLIAILKHLHKNEIVKEKFPEYDVPAGMPAPVSTRRYQAYIEECPEDDELNQSISSPDSPDVSVARYAKTWDAHDSGYGTSESSSSERIQSPEAVDTQTHGQRNRWESISQWPGQTRLPVVERTASRSGTPPASASSLLSRSSSPGSDHPSAASCLPSRSRTSQTFPLDASPPHSVRPGSLVSKERSAFPNLLSLRRGKEPKSESCTKEVPLRGILNGQQGAIASIYQSSYPRRVPQPSLPQPRRLYKSSFAQTADVKEYGDEWFERHGVVFTPSQDSASAAEAPTSITCSARTRSTRAFAAERAKFAAEVDMLFSGLIAILVLLVSTVIFLGKVMLDALALLGAFFLDFILTVRYIAYRVYMHSVHPHHDHIFIGILVIAVPLCLKTLMSAALQLASRSWWDIPSVLVVFTYLIIFVWMREVHGWAML